MNFGRFWAGRYFAPRYEGDAPTTGGAFWAPRYWAAHYFGRRYWGQETRSLLMTWVRTRRTQRFTEKRRTGA